MVSNCSIFSLLLLLLSVIILCAILLPIAGSQTSSSGPRSHAQVCKCIHTSPLIAATHFFHCAHRVVGLWDMWKESMKCYSVRPVRPKEEQYIKQNVDASDQTMRQLVMGLPEM